MNKKFLDKVLDQIVSETEIDYDKKEIYLPFFHSLFSFYHLFLFLSTISLPGSFYKHCKNIYGLNDDEVDYVWEEYRNIIKDEIEK